MFEIFEDVTVWTVIIAFLAVWLAWTLYDCLEGVKGDCEKGYETFAVGFVIFGSLSTWAAAHFDLPYYLAWGIGGGIVFTLLFIRTASMREFRNTFLEYFAGTFWGCWLPGYDRSSRKPYHHDYTIDDEHPDYGLSSQQQELIERFNEGMDRWGVRSDSPQDRNGDGVPLDIDGNTDWNAVEQEAEHYNDLDILSRD